MGAISTIVGSAQLGNGTTLGVRGAAQRPGHVTYRR